MSEHLPECPAIERLPDITSVFALIANRCICDRLRALSERISGEADAAFKAGYQEGHNVGYMKGYEKGQQDGFDTAVRLGKQR